MPFLLSLLQINFSFISRHTNIKVSVLLSLIFSFIFVFIVLRHRRIRQKIRKIMSSNKRRNERKNKELFDNFFFFSLLPHMKSLSLKICFFLVLLVPLNDMFILFRTFLSMDEKWEKNFCYVLFLNLFISTWNFRYHIIYYFCRYNRISFMFMLNF